jgi:shikimate kinase
MLLQNGALGASMSGTGTAVFGLFDDEECLKPAKANAKEAGWRCAAAVPWMPEWKLNKIVKNLQSSERR